MDRARLEALRSCYRDGLLLDVLPFWLRHGIDRESGGYSLCLGRDGTVLDHDKGMWQHCRFAWLLSHLYRKVEPRPEWLDAAQHGLKFIRAHGFAENGRMLFQVTRDGRPLRQRRYAYTEAFAAIAFASFAAAAEDASARETAIRLFESYLRYSGDPTLLEPKVDPNTRPACSLGPPMITLVTAQILRETLGLAAADSAIDDSLSQIEEKFVRPDLRVVLEQATPAGEVIDHFDGRTLNPGHAIEAAWFVMEEGRLRGDQDLIGRGARMLDWTWARGWDPEYGGILYFVDLNGGPVQEYWHDMKFWWPHNEAIVATLLAHELTGAARYGEWHRAVHDWAYRHFPDSKHGEWFGYLHRDGRRSVDLKGNLWKGPFHLPRMQWTAWQIVERLLARA